MGQRTAISAVKRFNGLLPVYKDSGMHVLDLLDTIRMTLEFETKLSGNEIGMHYHSCPRLRKQDEGILHLAFGLRAKQDIKHLWHAPFTYHVRAVLGHRMPCLLPNGQLNRSTGQLLY